MEKYKGLSFTRLRVRLNLVLVLLLILVSRPSSPRFMLIGTMLAGLGESLRIWAAGHLKKGEALTVSGPYAYTRNPLYLGSAVIGLGFCVASFSATRLINTVLVWSLIIAGYCIIYFVQIRREEEFLKETYKEEYETYGKNVPSLFPLLVFSGRGERERFSMKRAIKNKEYKTVFAVTSVFLILLFRLICS